MLRIVVDENIPYARETFGRLGEVTFLPGRRISPDAVKEADVLIVRSITQVNANLLGGSSVKFVGTATIGFDHVDVDYLAAHQIPFSSAPGSNANSVAEYLVSALLTLAERQDLRLDKLALGVIGVGNVGSRVVGKARALGMECLLNDPPKFRVTGDPKYRPLAEVLDRADVVTVHVPLERSGEYPTWKMADLSFFEHMKSGARFVNTSRGQVVDEAALAAVLKSGKVSAAILDVWENEPAIDPALLGLVLLGTPHIAGYSFDGKAAATVMLYNDLCRWLGSQTAVGLRELLPASPVPTVDLVTVSAADEDILRELVRKLYDIREDDQKLREAMQAAEGRGELFDRLRKEYRPRREFQNTLVRIAKSRPGLVCKVRGLGFEVAEV